MQVSKYWGKKKKSPLQMFHVEENVLKLKLTFIISGKPNNNSNLVSDDAVLSVELDSFRKHTLTLRTPLFPTGVLRGVRL